MTDPISEERLMAELREEEEVREEQRRREDREKEMTAIEWEGSR